MPLDTLAYIKTRSPLKVVLIFVMGIILPSGVLSYIGLRSYRNEARLMQKEAEERYAAVADLVKEKAEKRILDLITPLQTVTGQPGFQQLSYVQILPVLLSPPFLQDLSGAKLYVFDESGQMVAPWPEVAPRGGERPERAELEWGSLTDEIERLERLEFVEKDYAGAIQGYSVLQTKTASPTLQAALLKNIAGDYRKLQQNRLAAMTYLKLARSYEHLMDLSGAPMGIVGRQMAIRLFSDERNWEMALDTQLDLFEGLIYRRWALKPSERDTRIVEIRKAIENLAATHGSAMGARKPRWDRLRNAHERLQGLELEGKRFLEHYRTGLFQRIQRHTQLEPGAIFQLPPTDPQSLAVVASIRSTSSQRPKGYLIAVVNTDRKDFLLDATRREAIQDSGLHIEWGRQLKQPGIQRQIDRIDPALQFTLTDGGASVRDKLFKQRQWIFGGIIGLSFLVILVGMVIMAHALKREMEVANLKADFVATVSHELRTPLTTISSIGERLSMGRYASEEERKEIYSILGQQTGRLRGLIEDILDFSKMLAGKKMYQQETLDLVLLVEEAIDHFEPLAESRGFEVIAQYPDTTIPIVGDSKALTQVILNLLSNALKYSGTCRTIDVRVHQNGQQGIVAVKDGGIGIAKVHQEKIFEKFYRIEKKGATHLEEGVGLGLAMVKHVIESHNGHVAVESQEGKGSTFSLMFPLAKGER